MREQVERLLRGAIEPGSDNTLDVDEIRDWLAELLEDREEERVDFPDEGDDIWNLIAADNDPDHEAVFVTAVIANEAVTLVAGRGEDGAVRQFGESDYPDDIAEIIPALSARFTLYGDPVTASEQELVKWTRDSG